MQLDNFCDLKNRVFWLFDKSLIYTKKLYPCDMAFSLGIVTNVKIWYNTGMKSKE